MTQLQLVNNVLRRLREDEVSSVADNAYAQLVAMFINDGIREVCEAYDWSSLLHTINVAIAPADFEYDLTALVSGGGDVDNADRVTTADSMLRFDARAAALCYLWDTDTSTEPNVHMRLIREDERMQRYQQDRDQDNIDPSMFSVTLAPSGDGYLLKLWPTPLAARHLRVVFATPQAELAIDGTADSTEVIVPNQVVEAYAHMMTANERGEEIGEPGNLLERRWQRILGGAIEAAMTADNYADRYVSVRD